MVPTCLRSRFQLLPGYGRPCFSPCSRAAAISALFHETDWRGNPPKLQVLDEASWAALQQLAATGRITLNTRATRHLTGEIQNTIQNPIQNPRQYAWEILALEFVVNRVWR